MNEISPKFADSTNGLSNKKKLTFFKKMKRRENMENDGYKNILRTLLNEYNNLRTENKIFKVLSKESIDFYLKFGFIHFRISNNGTNILHYMEKHRNNIQGHLEIYGLSDNILLKKNKEEIKAHFNKIKKDKAYPYKFNTGWIFGTEYKTKQEREKQEEKEKEISTLLSIPPSSSAAHQNHSTIIMKIPDNIWSELSCGNSKIKEDKVEPIKVMNDFIAQSKYSWLLRNICFPFYKNFYNKLVETTNPEIIGLEKNQESNDDYFNQNDWYSSIEHSHFIFNNLKIFDNSIQEEDKLHFLPGIFKDKKGFDKKQSPTYLNCNLSSQERLKYPRGFLYCGNHKNKGFGLVPGLCNLDFKTLIENLATEKRSFIVGGQKKDRTSEGKGERPLPPPEEENKSSKTISSYFDKRTSVRAIPPKELQLENYIINLELEPGDYVIYHPSMPTKFDQIFESSEDDHFYGLNVMFMKKDDMFKNFEKVLKDYLFSQRTICFLSKQVLSDERLFGHVLGNIFEKKRGKKFICSIENNEDLPNDFKSYDFHYNLLLKNL